jgi:hypothetical protein
MLSRSLAASVRNADTCVPQRSRQLVSEASDAGLPLGLMLR